MAGAELRTGRRRFLGSFTGALMALAAIVPGLGAVLITILYVYQAPTGVTGPKAAPGATGRAVASAGVDSVWLSGTGAYLVGTAAALLCWVVLALVFRTRLSSVETANSAVYRELRVEFDSTASRLRSNPITGKPSTSDTAAAAHAEATAQLALCKELDPEAAESESYGMDWVLATGYLTLWRRIHRADEALLLIEPIPDVVGRALEDQARLENSAIPGRDQLLGQLGRVIVALEPVAAHLANLPEEVLPKLARDPGTESRAEREPASDRDAVERQSRMVLRNTARIIHEFRDDRREGLIRARNNLYRTVFVTAITAYLLYGLALLRQVDELAIVAMVSFYLVGSILGLFRQLGQASSIDTVKEGDYGLSTARLFYTPLLSGLAAVGGVVLVAEAGAVIPTADGQVMLPGLGQIFDLAGNQFGLIAAAVFGLTPNLLNQRLERQAEQYKDDLKSTEASGAVSPPASAE